MAFNLSQDLFSFFPESKFFHRVFPYDMSVVVKEGAGVVRFVAEVEDFIEGVFEGAVFVVGEVDFIEMVLHLVEVLVVFEVFLVCSFGCLPLDFIVLDNDLEKGVDLNLIGRYHLEDHAMVLL
jgi:hypothetical protein